MSAIRNHVIDYTHHVALFNILSIELSLSCFYLIKKHLTPNKLHVAETFAILISSLFLSLKRMYRLGCIFDNVLYFLSHQFQRPGLCGYRTWKKKKLQNATEHKISKLNTYSRSLTASFREIYLGFLSCLFSESSIF